MTPIDLGRIVGASGLGQKGHLTMCLDDGEVAAIDRGDLIDADQRPRMGLQQLRARLVVLIVGIDVGVERTRVNDDGYGVTSLPKISSIRSEMSCRPLLPAARAPSTRRP